MTDSPPQESENTPAARSVPHSHAMHVKIAREFIQNLAAQKQAEREQKHLEAEEARFKRYERRYGWTRTYYIWFCHQPPDIQKEIDNKERQALHRKNRRGGKPAREWQSLDGLSDAEKADRLRQQKRESYQRKQAEKMAQEQAEIAARAIV